MNANQSFRTIQPGFKFTRSPCRCQRPFPSRRPHRACTLTPVPNAFWGQIAQGPKQMVAASPASASSSPSSSGGSSSSGSISNSSAAAAPQAAGASSSSSTSRTTTSTSTQAGTSAATPSASSSSTSTSSSSMESNAAALSTLPPALLRKVLAAESAPDAADLLQSERPDLAFTEQLSTGLIAAALERGNMKLALSIHDAMAQARRVATGASLASIDASCSPWPPASVAVTTALVLGLCRQLAIEQAISTINHIRIQGLPSNDAIGFGKVVPSPLAPNQTLTVVQPQEGCKVVADAFSRYEYEVFSGKVVSTKSEALQPATGLVYSALRAAGILKRPAPAAVHEFVVQAPDGQSRTFRVATANADVPAQVSERVTFVCAPGPATARSPKRKQRQGLLPSSPPDTKPGEALTALNHKTGAVTQLLPPPLTNTQAVIPSWVLPAAIVLAGGDAASSLVDPALPALIAGGAVGLIGTGVVGDRVVIPRLKQLPEKAVTVEYVRQQLLGQYARLMSKVETVMAESAEDVRVLSKLWQLQNKMAAVVGGAAAAGGSASYSARIERVAAARTNIEERLAKKLELLDGYSRVMNMIEIEVEIDIEVPVAELAGIEMQMARLEELEGLQDDWRAQAEARDEVERLLRMV